MFEERRSEDFAKASNLANWTIYFLEELRGDGPRGLAIDLRFPTNKYSAVEPLVVDGERGAQDFLFLRYVGPGLVEIGFESTGYGSVISPVLRVDYKISHRIELRYGSFLPPRGHPLLASFSEPDLSLARKMLIVLLDGRIVLDGDANFHPKRANVFVGYSPFDAAFGYRFSGTIIGIEHPRLSAFASPDRWKADSYGSLGIESELIPMPVGVFDPLVSLGLRGHGAQLLVEHLDADRVRFVWLDTDHHRTVGKIVLWPSHKMQRIELRVGSLFPPMTSNLWPPNIPIRVKLDLKKMLLVKMQGKIVLEDEISSPDVSPTTVAVGADTLSLIGGVMPLFSGSLHSAIREAW
jgi:hypothetical protein